jgi:hypothetical protein
MPRRAFAELDHAIRVAAADAYGCEDADEIFVELEEQYLTLDGRKSILVNWSQSQKASDEVRAAVNAAVSTAVPPPFNGYHVVLL